MKKTLLFIAYRHQTIIIGIAEIVMGTLLITTSSWQWMISGGNHITTMILMFGAYAVYQGAAKAVGERYQMFSFIMLMYLGQMALAAAVIQMPAFAAAVVVVVAWIRFFIPLLAFMIFVHFFSNLVAHAFDTPNDQEALKT